MRYIKRDRNTFCNTFVIDHNKYLIPVWRLYDISGAVRFNSSILIVAS